MDAAALAEHAKTLARALGFDLVGVARADPGPHSTFLDGWLARGNAAEMAYLTHDPERRKDPRVLLPGARSVIACGLNYHPGDEPSEAAGRGITARYARGTDYHDVVKDKLLALIERIRAEVPDPFEARAYVDTGPVLEREAAALAGLGQFGKNTLLISRELGSYFFLGVILTTLELAPDASSTKDICGRCTRCLDACPTGAFAAPFDLDARRCISYLTIEHRGSIPRELRPLMGSRVFGCDICQEVCPWNRRARRASAEALAPRPESTAPSLVELLRLSQGDFSVRFRGSPIKRAKRRGLLRNAAVALGNQADPAAVPALADALADPEPLVRSHAAWALGRIGTAEALAALRSALAREEEGEVRGEIEDALAGRA